MLSEAITYLTTSCEPRLRAMGYLSELIATEARYRRCKAAWSPHLEKTKTVIRNAIQATVNRESVVVLGAGILCDIPVETLSENFEKVILADVCFLRRTKRQARHFGNLEWLCCDITGQDQPDLREAGLVVSANVLTQLPLVPRDHLRKTNRNLSNEQLTAVCTGIIEAHLAYLTTCPGTICLISETERRYIGGADIPGTEDPLYGVPLGIGGEEWAWDLAPKGELSRDFAIQNTVVGGYRRG